MQNHHLTSISTSPQKTAQQFFLIQIPICINTVWCLQRFNCISFWVWPLALCWCCCWYWCHG